MTIFRLISILTLTLFFILPTQLVNAFITQNTGCHHNGTWYADKSLVPTIEKCLNCQCNKKTLVCRLKVCPEMPMPPPRGCVVVQKKNTCCPYLSCARLDAFYKIPTKRRIIAYLDHYERESIDRVVNENVLQRRSDDTEVDLFVCVKNGTVYKSGSAMSSSNLCSYCYCIGGTEKCVKPKCMLPVEGCKPIFVDSTCCPVRYDCSQKTSGKSSQEVRYRKTSNKHFLRMSQRPQRNRGCTVGKQYYAEGQKMKSDVDKPCDICFCIRGSRRCAPKKCAPALKNCIPVVPKGQCCPSSYDCGSQRDYRRAHKNSRQFNLFSLFFGKDENNTQNGSMIAEHYPHDRHPTPSIVGDAVQASSEKSIFDTLREGLEFIDSNNSQMLAENLDLVALQQTDAPPTPATSSTTGVSFLDLLLGPTEYPVDQAASNSVKQTVEEEKGTTISSNELSWMDLLLGPDDDDDAENFNNKTATTEDDKSVLPQVESSTEQASHELTTNIERISDDFDDYLGSGEIAVGELPAAAQNLLTNNAKLAKKPNNDAISFYNKTESPTNVKLKTKTDIHLLVKATTTAKPLSTTTIKALKKTQATSATAANTTNSTKPSLQQHLFNAFLDGISNILGNENNETKTITTTAIPPNITHILTTTRPPPFFRPLPSQKPHVRINSKIANLTVSPPPMITTKPAQNITFKPLPNVPLRIPVFVTNNAVKTTKTNITTTTSTTTAAPRTKQTTTTTKPTRATTPTRTTTKPNFTTTSTTTTTTTLATISATRKIFITSTTHKPLLIKTNPTILEAEPLDESNAEPTLPPSLPNLKIIPFLPTDAVDTVAQNPAVAGPAQQFDYYNNGNIGSNTAAAKVDYEKYEAPNLYPAITADFPIHDKAEYIYKFNIEGPETVPADLSPPPSVETTGKFEGSADYVKYDFGLDGTLPSKGFSPPTKTEGGFVPKDPLLIDDIEMQPQHKLNLEQNYHATQHIIDITTALPENTTKLIEITTPDPFKDVIRTETPPDLNKLIEDMQQIEAKQQQLTLLNPKPNTTNKNEQHVIDKSEIAQINKLDELLDELLGVVEHKKIVGNTTVPPFKTIPTKQSDVAFSKPTKVKSKVTTAANGTASAKPTTTLADAKNKTLTSTVMNGTTTTSTASSTTTMTTMKIITRTKTKPKNAQRVTPATPYKRPAAGSSATATAKQPHSKIKVQQQQLAAQRRNTTKISTATVAAPTATATRRPATATTTPVSEILKTTAKLSIANYTANAMKSKITQLPTPKTTRFTTTTLQPPTTTTNRILSTTTPPHTAITTTTAVAMHPFLMSPFDKLPFLDTSYQVKPNMPQPTQSTHHPELYDVVHYKHTLNQYEGLEPNFDNSYTSSTTQTTTTNSVLSSSSVSSAASNSLIDSSGMLKLAGCNIYGRMYRVGRIILELSSPCLECKCTEVGVKCGPLDC